MTTATTEEEEEDLNRRYPIGHRGICECSKKGGVAFVRLFI